MFTVLPLESEDELSPWMYEEGARQVYQRLGVFSMLGKTISGPMSERQNTEGLSASLPLNTSLTSNYFSSS